jgi:hypothetical protein
MKLARRKLLHLAAGAAALPAIGEAEGLGGLEVDNQFELGGELNRQLAHLCAAQNAIDIRGGARIQIEDCRGSIGDQSACSDI